jgi:cbb3-type cytochrome oxidase subunit 3
MYNIIKNMLYMLLFLMTWCFLSIVYFVYKTRKRIKAKKAEILRSIKD